MSDIITHAIEALNKKLNDGYRRHRQVPDRGRRVHHAGRKSGVREGDEEAEVTMIASTDTFRGILDGSVNPTMAFMSGDLKIEGSMGAAMKLGSALS